ncbi:MAG: stage III sporulation protein AG [Acutalibacteraceae bacterium]
MLRDDKDKKIHEFLLKDKFKKIIIFVGILGIALIFFSGLLKTSGTKKTKSSTQNSSTKEYVFQLESSLREMVSSIKGAGNTKVLVTLENSEETVYATEEKKNKEATEDKTDGQLSKKRESDDCEKKYITIKDADGTERALSVTQIQPTVKGVVVVCDGGDIPEVQQRVTEAIKTALNITSKRVYVTK